MKTHLLFAALVLSLSACTAQERAKHLGGTVSVNLPKCEKLVMTTWKESDLWYLTRKFKKGDSPESYTFREDSPYGVIEGTVLIKESCPSAEASE